MKYTKHDPGKYHRPGSELSYWAHLRANVNIAIHAQKDVLAHLIHGFIPFIEISHHGPYKSHNPKHKLKK